MFEPFVRGDPSDALGSQGALDDRGHASLLIGNVGRSTGTGIDSSARRIGPCKTRASLSDNSHWA